MKDNMRYKPISTLLLCCIFIIGGATSSYASWLIYHKPELRGKVIDSETKEPIEGAVVVAVYKKYSTAFIHSYTYNIKLRETLTDENGEFLIPSYTTIIQPFSWEGRVELIIYKPGYGNFPDSQKIPAGIQSTDEEVYFSKETGSKGTLDMWVKGARGPKRKRFDVVFGIVELPKLMTWQERRNANRISVTGGTPKSEWPILNDMLKKEDKWLKRNRGRMRSR